MQSSRYLHFNHDDWGELRNSTPMTLSEADLEELRGVNERVSLDEVAEIYLPLSRLLNLHVAATQRLARTTETFLGHDHRKVPYVLGIAGSVAVGKSTTARVLQALLARWPDHPRVDLVTTDGFLHPNAVLEKHGLMKRKGFPESYDQRRLVRFLIDVKAGAKRATAPVYSHQSYDVVPGELKRVERPDIVIVEGLNVLQTGRPAEHPLPVFVSDFFDFSIYVDAEAAHIEQWYVDRFLTLRDTVFQDPASYFHRYTHLSRQEATETARGIWEEINGPNLRENIEPTRERAHLILEKDAEHRVTHVRLRRV